MPTIPTNSRGGPINSKSLTFTIVTPSFNQGQFLERTIESVIAQNYPHVEYYVFDGGSTDESVSILEKYDHWISYWESKPDRGQTHAVNKGLEKAQGDIIGWLNSDDIYYPGAFDQVAAFFEKNPKSNFVYGMADHIDVRDEIMEPYYTEPWDYQRLQKVCFICQPAMFFRKSVVEKYGMLDETLDLCMDFEFWLRCGGKEDFHYLESPLAGSRLYADNKTLGSRPQVLEEIIRMLQSKFNQVDKQWIASLSLEQARQKYGYGQSRNRKIFGMIYAAYLWRRNLWSINHALFPLLPKEYFLNLKILPQKSRNWLQAFNKKS